MPRRTTPPIPPRRLRDPERDKHLSYARDRRNCYGQSERAARRVIPLRKKARLRADRHHIHQILGQATGPTDTDRAEHTEQALHRKRSTLVTGFRKYPDWPLRDEIRHQRIRHGFLDRPQRHATSHVRMPVARPTATQIRADRATGAFRRAHPEPAPPVERHAST
jgi:hypothetical protein